MLSTAFNAGAANADSLRISVFGDSVLLGAAPAIQAALAGNDVSIDAHEDVSLLGSLGTLQAARPTIGDVVVLDLGYNDGSDPGAWGDRIDQAMAILAGVPKVIWLDQSYWATGRAEMDAQLAAAVQRYPNLEVVDWHSLVAAHPDYVYGDGIHLTPSGQAAMGALVGQRVAAFVAARTAATSTTTSTTSTTLPSTTVPSAGAPSTAAPRTDDSSGDDAIWFALAIAAGLVLLVAATLAVRARHGRSSTRRRRRR